MKSLFFTIIKKRKRPLRQSLQAAWQLGYLEPIGNLSIVLMEKQAMCPFQFIDVTEVALGPILS